MLYELERVRSWGIGYKGIERSRATRERREKRRKRAWVEIHTRATDWFAHQHHTDVRYNTVVLHSVLICDNRRPTLRQDGTIIPTCSLNDISSTTRTRQQEQWPCHRVIAQIHKEELTRLLALAGTRRFEMKTQVFFDVLRDAQPTDIFSMYDVCLLPALAEALGFGRDRAFFRAAGPSLLNTLEISLLPILASPQTRLHVQWVSSFC